jgi:DNA-binding Lrp family transcriptional regulator
MVRMFILCEADSEELAAMRKAVKEKVDIYTWAEYPYIPRLSDYEIAVLDMDMSKDYSRRCFIGLAKVVIELLNSGGVIICLNYFTVKTQAQVHSEDNDPHPAKIQAQRRTRYEINYDWLAFDLELLSALNVAQLDARIGKNFDVITKEKAYTEYLKGVSQYHKTIGNIIPKEDDDGRIIGYKLYVSYNRDYDAKVMAVAHVTKQPVACSINYSKGSLVFLPATNGDEKTIIGQLLEIGTVEYEKNIQSIEEHLVAPEWLDKHKVKQELDVESEIHDIVAKLEAKKIEHKRFEAIDVLLYGTGTPLEDAVKKVLEEMGCSVEKTEEGATIDLKARMNSMKFAIEITGVDDKIYKDSNKFGQILQYLPLQEENEKIVLLANTYRSTDIKERIGKEHFTEPVIQIAKNNHFCLMTTADLYLMWRGFLNGKHSKEMLAQVFSVDGEFKYSST